MLGAASGQWAVDVRSTVDVFYGEPSAHFGIGTTVERPWLSRTFPGVRWVLIVVAVAVTLVVAVA